MGDSSQSSGGEAGGRMAKRPAIYFQAASVLGTDIGETETYPFFSSTGAVYGECGNEPAIEATALAPKSYYAAGKVAAEELLHQYSAHGKGKVAILRISNLYGAQGVSKVPKGVIAKLAECFHKNTQPTIWGDGTATKDYLHVDDFCEAVYRVLAERLEGV